MNSTNDTFTPSSMRSSLSSLAIFRKTKPKNWAFNGRAARRKMGTGGFVLEIDLPQAPKERSLRVNFYPKSGVFRTADKREIKGFENVKLTAKTHGFTHVILGGKKYSVG